MSLPYGQGRLSMLVVLPNPGVDLDSFVATMTPSDIDTWVSQQVDHPFFYAIRDNTTGDLLFVGVLRSPSGG